MSLKGPSEKPEVDGIRAHDARTTPEWWLEVIENAKDAKQLLYLLKIILGAPPLKKSEKDPSVSFTHSDLLKCVVTKYDSIGEDIMKIFDMLGELKVHMKTSIMDMALKLALIDVVLESPLTEKRLDRLLYLKGELNVNQNFLPGLAAIKLEDVQQKINEHVEAKELQGDVKKKADSTLVIKKRKTD